jgi:5'-nucleotidase
MNKKNLLRFSVLLGLGSLFAGCAIEGTEDASVPGPLLPPAAEAYMPPAAEPVSKGLVILHTNDEHSHLFGFGPISDYPFVPDATGEIDTAQTGAIVQKILAQHTMGQHPYTVGGVVRRDYLVNQVRQSATDPVLLISAGDSTMGTLFHVAGSLGAPDFLSQAVLGYDYVTIGNHEFDFGADFYADSLKTVNNLSLGGGVQVISSNIHFPAGLAPGMPGYELQQLVGEPNSGAPIVPWVTRVLPNGLKIGVMGLLGYRAALVAPFKSPVYFSVPRDGADCSTAACANPMESCIAGRCVDPLDAEGHVMAMVLEAQDVIDTLRMDEGVDLVILISHLGVSVDPTLSEDTLLATFTRGIDVIVGGHSHDALPSPLIINGTVIVQAGNYGTKLGQLTLDVSSDGAVTVDDGDDATLLHDVDSSLDIEIYGDTNLHLAPAPQDTVIDPAFERALTLTGGVIGPVAGAINGLLVPQLNANLLTPLGKTIGSVFSSVDIDGDELVTSNHDIVGEAASADSHLSHLVTDAEWGTMVQRGCLIDFDGPGNMFQTVTNARFVVAVQANGVLRESLRFGTDHSTTVDDIFRVVPLGISPFAQTTPGYPLVMFQLTLPHLFAGIEVGVGQGLSSDDFFLSYAGMRVEYDPDLPAFAGVVNPTSAAPQGRVRRIEMSNGAGGWVEIFHQDPDDTTTPWALRWSNVDLATDKALIITNLYLAGFLEGFQLTPLDPYTGAAITTSANPYVPGSLRRLAKTIVCNVATSANCATPAPSMAPCVNATGGDVPATFTWQVAPGVVLPEVKEWFVLLGFLTSPPPALNGNIPDCVYETDAACPFQSRVSVYSP